MKTFETDSRATTPEEVKLYCISYRLLGSTFSFRFPAASWEDAELFAKSLPHGEVDGEFDSEVSAITVEELRDFLHKSLNGCYPPPYWDEQAEAFLSKSR